jgi:hypothetical protein
MEQRTKEVLAVNLIIFAAYTLLSYVFGFKDQSGWFYHVFAIAIHAITNFLIGLIRMIAVKNNTDGGAYMLSALLILIIGFGTCVGLNQLTEQLSHKEVRID